jgi:hypothetical protein
VRRSCSRPGCAAPAAATFSYDYASSTVWLDDLSPEAHPATYDLCAAHADRLAPPRGWHLADRRADPSTLRLADGRGDQRFTADLGAIAS